MRHYHYFGLFVLCDDDSVQTICGGNCRDDVARHLLHSETSLLLNTKGVGPEVGCGSHKVKHLRVIFLKKVIKKVDQAAAKFEI